MKKIGILHLIIVIVVSMLCFTGSFYFGLQKTIAFAKEHMPTPPTPAEESDARKELANTSIVVPKDQPVDKWVVPQKVAEELDGWRKELEEREKKVLAQDADILRRNNLIKAEQESLAKERARLNSIQKEIESRLIVVSQAEVTNIEQIAQLYSTMKPAEAAGIIRQLPDEQIAKLFAIMKSTKSAKLLEIWGRTFPDDRERLARISDQMMMVLKSEEQPKVTINAQ